MHLIDEKAANTNKKMDERIIFETSLANSPKLELS